MNQQTSLAFLEKMISAKQLEMEAVMLLLPEKMKGHIEVIGKEVKSMLKDCLMDMAAKHAEDTPKEKHSPTNSSVRKVDIV